MNLLRILSCLALSLLCACGSSDVVGMHIELAADGSALVTTRSLLGQKDPGPVEETATGIEWSDRVRLVCSRGRVASLDELVLDGIRFDSREGGLRVTVPCGPDVRWIDRFAPPPEERARAVETFDPRDETPDVGSRLMLEVVVPGEVISTGVLPSFGARAAHERGMASLELTVASVRERERSVIWDVTWR